MFKVLKWLLILVGIILIIVFSGTVHSQRGLSSADQEFKERYLDGAGLIVVGKVLSTVTSAPVGLLDSQQQDPNWQVVTVEVSSVFAGNSKKGDRVQVIFPGTTSIIWAGPPKLITSEEYVFILQDATLYRSLLIKPEKINRGQYFLAIRPECVQSKIRAAKIKAMIH